MGRAISFAELMSLAYDVDLSRVVPPPDKVTAPDLGEHNQAVLRQYLQYDETRIAQLMNDAVLVSARTPRE